MKSLTEQANTGYAGTSSLCSRKTQSVWECCQQHVGQPKIANVWDPKHLRVLKPFIQTNLDPMDLSL